MSTMRRTSCVSRSMGQHMTRRLGRCLSLAFGALVLHAGSAAGQTYPDHPIRLVVPYAAGGGADLIARTIAQGLTKRLGQQVIVDNKPGGAATIGADAVAKSPPDGYTLLYGTPAPQIINPYLMKKLPYDLARDFAP